MKRIWLRIGFLVLIVLAALLIILGISLDRVVRNAVVTAGPEITQVDVKLEKVSLSLLSGNGELHGLVVGNPAGFNTPSAIEIGQVKLSLIPSSVLADKVVIRSLELGAPLITLEGGLRGNNNLTALLRNIEETLGGGANPAEQPGASKKLQVDQFIMRNAQLKLSLVVLRGKSAIVSLPDIELRNLGQGPEGISAAALARTILKAVVDRATVAAAGYVSGLGGKVSQSAKGAADKILDLFKKKEE